MKQENIIVCWESKKTGKVYFIHYQGYYIRQGTFNHWFAFIQFYSQLMSTRLYYVSQKKHLKCHNIG